MVEEEAAYLMVVRCQERERLEEAKQNSPFSFFNNAMSVVQEALGNTDLNTNIAVNPTTDRNWVP